MGNVVEHLTSGSRFLFWGIVPLGTFLMVLLNIGSRWDNKGIALLLLAIDFTFLLLVIGLYDPKRFSWAWRLLMAGLYVAYSIYTIHTIFFAPRRHWTDGLDALHGFIVIGIPALLYATRGLKRRKRLRRATQYDPMPIEPE